MEKMKKTITKIWWWISSPIWKHAIKRYSQLTVPSRKETTEFFGSILLELQILGESARHFDSQVSNRLRIVLYWAAMQSHIKLEVTKTPSEIMEDINISLKDNAIRRNNRCPFKFEKKTANGEWDTPRFPICTIWGKPLSEENADLAYLTNLLLS